MTYGKITNKQREVLEYLKQQVLQKGYPPSVREICDAVGLKSTSSVHAHLESLERNGYIRKDPTKPRAIEIVDDVIARISDNKSELKLLMMALILFAQRLSIFLRLEKSLPDSQFLPLKISMPIYHSRHI